MKDHIKREFNNKLRDIAIEYKDCQCLRDAICRVTSEIHRQYEEEIAAAYKRGKRKITKIMLDELKAEVMG